MVRTRIRQNQEQDIDFVSESELNQFFDRVVITGTLAGDQDNEDGTQDTEIVQVFHSYFPGQGLVQGQDGTTVVTGTNLVTISGAVLGVGTINTISGTVDILPGSHTTVDTDPFTNTITVDSFDDVDVDSITASGVTVTGSVEFVTVGGSSVTADAATNVVTFSGGANVGELIGNFFQIEFTNGGSTANTWLAVSDSNLSSTSTPWVVAYDCRLAGLAFSNRNENIEQDIEIYVSRFGTGNTNTLEFVWELRNIRTSAKTDIDLDELQLFEGDKVAVFCRDRGNNARDVFCGIYVEITARTNAELGENWAGNF